MRTATLLTLGLTALTLLLKPTPSRAAAHGGEDWPFFCRIGQGDGAISSFRLVKDDNAPYGYGMEFYDGDDYVAYVYPSVSDSDDKKFLIVWGAERIGLFKARERQVLAYLSKEDVTKSSGGVDTTWAGGQGEFYMQPLNCKAPLPSD